MFVEAGQGSALFMLTTLLGADNSALLEHVIVTLGVLATTSENCALVNAGAAGPADQKSGPFSANGAMQRVGGARRVVVAAHSVREQEHLHCALGGMLAHAMDDETQTLAILNPLLGPLLEREQTSMATGRELLLFGSLGAVVGAAGINVIAADGQSLERLVDGGVMAAVGRLLVDRYRRQSVAVHLEQRH